MISIHALLAESDIKKEQKNITCSVFLSTLSLRRATAIYPSPTPPKEYFYPRSPCGERLQPRKGSSCLPIISIHALLAESDNQRFETQMSEFLFLSTLSLRRATWWLRCWKLAARDISIHALLAESDPLQNQPQQKCKDISIHALLAESDR